MALFFKPRQRHDPRIFNAKSYLGLAKNYGAAAAILEQSKNSEVCQPTHYLIAVAIELALKAILFSVGKTPREVEAFKHDLIGMCKVMGNFGVTLPLEQRDRDTLQLVSHNYSTHMLRYVGHGPVTFPKTEHALEVMKIIIDAAAANNSRKS